MAYTSQAPDKRNDESIDIEPRDVRALTEKMTVLCDTGRARDVPDIVTVVSESGSEYLVDLRLGACECPDSQHRDPDGGCKHLRRALFARGERPIPAWVDTDAVDPQLGEHTNGTPRVAVTDGGEAVVSDVEPQGSDGREPEDDVECEDCAALPEGSPCFECFSEGKSFADNGGSE